MTSRTGLISLAVIAAGAIGAAGCGSSGNGYGGNAGASNTKTMQAASTTGTTVSAADNGKLGKILVDSKGDTLYVFGKDTSTKSMCSGACAMNWPPLLASGKPTAGDGATAAKLGTTQRSDGAAQVTYGGHPVYTFSGDQSAGDTNGQGINAFGGQWHVTSAAGSAVDGGASSDSSGGSSSGGGY
jgi:predicted lipoprotein with Yx(FWY)xxD motif